jgi:hypothetical protein
MVKIIITDDGQNATLTLDIPKGGAFKSESAKKKYLWRQLSKATEVAAMNLSLEELTEAEMDMQIEEGQDEQSN